MKRVFWLNGQANVKQRRVSRRGTGRGATDALATLPRSEQDWPAAAEPVLATIRRAHQYAVRAATPLVIKCLMLRVRAHVFWRDKSVRTDPDYQELFDGVIDLLCTHVGVAHSQEVNHAVQ
jgi:hypothetical protein